MPHVISLEIRGLSFMDANVDARDPGSFQKAKLTRFLFDHISIEDLRILLGRTTATFDLTQLQELSIGFELCYEFLNTDVVESLILASGKVQTLSLKGKSCNSKTNT